MHVLVVSNHGEIKKKYVAAGIFVDRQIDSLQKIGIQVSTFDIGASHSPIHLYRQVVALRKTVRDLGINVVHARYGTITAFVSLFSGKHLVITFAGSDLLAGASVSSLRTYSGILISNLASLFSSSLICVSEELRQSLWWREKDACVIPDGVDLSRFMPGNQKEARQKLGWGTEHPIAIIDAARDAGRKGLSLALEAMDNVKKMIPTAELIILRDVQPDDMHLCYQAADVLICASILEGSPNVVKEALACNLPVVSVPVGDVIERLSSVIPSAIVPRDSRLMGDALIEILNTRQRSNGRNHVMELGLDKIALRVREIYLSAMENGKNA